MNVFLRCKCHFVLQYYQAANEADAWMNDKAGIAASHDFGRDEDAAIKALKKHKVRNTRPSVSVFTVMIHRFSMYVYTQEIAYLSV